MTIPSTVDWCEDNYAVVNYIAEFYNTISSFVLLAAGLYGYIQYYRLKGSSVYVILAIVGAGSVAFHATLTAGNQMLDEIPMIYLVIQLFINSLKLSKQYSTILYIFGTIHSLFMWNSVSLPTFQFVTFQLSIIFMGAAIFFSLLYHTRSEPSRRLLFFKGCCFFLAGWGCWLLDFFFCNTVKRYGLGIQLHAFWHLLSAVGVYEIALVTVIKKV